MTDCLDCDVTVNGFGQATLRVAGADYSGRPDLDEDQQRRLLEAGLDPQHYGSLLFTALFRQGDDLLTGYRAALALAQHSERTLRLRLSVADTAPAVLHELNWEEMFDPKLNIALGRSRETIFSRYAAVPLPPPPPLTERPRLLVVVASPHNLSSFGLSVIAVDDTRRQIEDALRPLGSQIDWTFLEGRPTPERVFEQLVQGQYHLLHLYAHGLLRADGRDARLVLEDEDGQAAFVDEDRFSNIFEGERGLRLVTMVACQSGAVAKSGPFGGLARALIARGCPAVVAMQKTISVESAMHFTRAFYGQLAAWGEVDRAVSAARQQLYLRDATSPEWSIPVLTTRLRDGRLWTPTATPVAPVRVDAAFPWRDIVSETRKGRIVPVLGPDINHGLIPTTRQVSARWVAEYGLSSAIDGRPEDLPRVAKIVETLDGIAQAPHRRLEEIYRDELLARRDAAGRKALEDADTADVFDVIGRSYFELDPEAPHAQLARLGLTTFITGNYDSLMSVALRWAGREPIERDCPWRGSDKESKSKVAMGDRASPLVLHLFGSKPTSFVLTEDDFLEFLRVTARDPWRLPDRLVRICSESILLFLGFNVRELSFRVLFKTLVSRVREFSDGARVAVLQIHDGSPGPQGDSHVRELDNFEAKYCDEINLKLYKGSVRGFLTELGKRVQE
ncbi:MAG: CHAT domain-containing protein [Acidobacteria bacterium]|nr:CHAT domain-containing protein [Acidobacteriota bacterium]